jgi:hypothetical protein
MVLAPDFKGDHLCESSKTDSLCCLIPYSNVDQLLSTCSKDEVAIATAFANVDCACDSASFLHDWPFTDYARRVPRLEISRVQEGWH